MSSTTSIERAIRGMLLAFDLLDATTRRALSLSHNDQLVLGLLATGVNAPTDLSRAVGITTAGMTNLLDRLEEDGFLRRERHATDGRRVLVVLTKSGMRARMRFEQLDESIAQIALVGGANSAALIEQFLCDATELARDAALSAP